MLCGQVDRWAVQLWLQGRAVYTNEPAQPAVSHSTKEEQMGPGAGWAGVSLWGLQGL